MESNANTVLSEAKKKRFYHMGGQTLEQVAQKVCGVSILRDMQTPVGHGSGQPAVVEVVLSRRIGLDSLQTSLSTSTVL